MIKVLQFVPVQITIFLLFGIYTGYYSTISFENLLPFILVGLLLILAIQYWRANKSFKRNLFFNSTTYLLSFFIGIATITINNDLNNQKHYTHYITSDATIILVVEKELKSGNYYDKYEASVININDKSTIGTILLNIQKDSLEKLKVDDKLYLKSTFKELIAPMNPYYFNYKEYLKKQNIYHQLFTNHQEFLMLNPRQFSFKGLAAQFRERVNFALIKNNFKGDELAVINALLLGQRQEISPELIQSYTGAGAIHILAVSGLHVGIILLILNFIFKPIERFKNGKTIKLILVVSLLWAFAFVAGLSASVVRAVTMFTAVAIGWQVNKPTNVYNTLTISMFFLLLFNPYFLFDVGFQLSYLAVFSIVWIQPLLYSFWKPKFKLLDYFWKLLTVSVAAQFGIIPISLYYFHQFPSLFFISNLVIIPFLGAILLGGVLIILLSLLNILPNILATVYNYLIRAMNLVVDWVAHQEDFLFRDISFSLLMVVSSYAMIVFGTRFLTKRNSNRLIGFCLALILFQSTFIYEKQQRLLTDEFIIFHKSRNSMLGKRMGNHMEFYHSLDSVTLAKDKVLRQYKVGVGALEIQSTNTIPNIMQFNTKRILIIDSLGVFQLKSYSPDLIFLQQSPKINLVRLIDSLNPKMIVADGSNYKSYIKRWELTCEQKNTPFHYTGQKGAYVLKY
ncbi:MAG: ComEC/Rec2 family competence protein [Urechidicola sp.]|nr:ComEC/Rec2 family competence protein [Urechidicola sp.]